ncbi:MAG: hypothetical protein JSV16_15360 [Candidatus Hydrogenedentota bacterium]|nr:MAG: hypothetical protein JSV16_15360 [Candidatus Hydrogenedentota bacterium]
MALTHTRVLEVADFCKAVCDEAKELHYRLKEFLDTNSDLAIDWSGDPKPSYINEDASGNLDGRLFTRDHVANAVNSLDNLRKTLDNESVTQGDHLGNVNQLAEADVPGD